MVLQEIRCVEMATAVTNSTSGPTVLAPNRIGFDSACRVQEAHFSDPTGAVATDRSCTQNGEVSEGLCGVFTGQAQQMMPLISISCLPQRDVKHP